MKDRRRRSAVVVLAGLLVCAITPVACAGQVGQPTQADDAVFHFVGTNLEAEHGSSNLGVYCYYDITLGCSLTSDLFGFRRYSVNWVSFRNQVHYVFRMLRGCPTCETYFVFLNGDDFDLSAAASEVQLLVKGTFVNPTAEDIYTVRLTLGRDKTFVTPYGTVISYTRSGGNELFMGTADSTYAYAEGGQFEGRLTWPCYAPDNPSIQFGSMLTQDSNGAICYLDADPPRGVVAGAAADGASRVVVEVSGSETTPKDSLAAGDGFWEEGEWQNMASSTWRRTWRAPMDFDSVGVQPDHLASRLVDLHLEIDGKRLGVPPLVLVKPPVVLLHGLFATGEMWDAMADALKRDYVSGDPLLVSAPDYDRDAHFIDNIDLVQLGVREAILRAREQRLGRGDPNVFGKIVVKKADIVAHSLGGIMANLYVMDAGYGYDVNRLITIETPHAGSEVANFVLHFFFCDLDLEQTLTWNLMNTVLGAINRSPTGGALEDLQVGSPAMRAYRNAVLSTSARVRVFPVTALHSGNAPGEGIAKLYRTLSTLDRVFHYPAPYFPGELGSPLSVEGGLFPGGQNSSDFIVSLASQAGGLPELAGEPLATLDHCNTANESDAAERVIALLNSPISIFAERFAAPLYPAAPVEPVVNQECSYDVGNGIQLAQHAGLPRMSGRALEVSLPTAGTVFAPGDSVYVEVSYSGSPYPRVLFLSASEDSASDTMAPYQFSFAIDGDFAGPLVIAAAAIDGDWRTADSLIAEVTVNVLPTAQPVRLRVMPDGPLYLTMGQTCQLRVKGIYPDSVARDISSSAVGTLYSSSTSSVATVGPNGLITALTPGETLVRVENGAAEEFYVIVDSVATTGMSFAGASAAAEGGCVKLCWEMGTEVPASSFRVERGASSGGEFTALGAPISKQSAHSFSCTDCSVVSGTAYWYRIVFSGADGDDVYGPIEASVPSTPIAFALHQNYPNPFNPKCTVRYEVLEARQVSLRIFDVAGASVRTLVSRRMEPGVYTELWDGRANDGTMMPSGVYFCRLEAGNLVATRKIVLLRTE